MVLTGPNGVASGDGHADLLDVSVVIVNYKVRDLLRECLRSLEHDLGVLRGEVWVVDNPSARTNSTEPSPEALSTTQTSPPNTPR